MNWIKTSEQMPLEGRPVLTYVASDPRGPETNPIVEAYYRDGIWRLTDLLDDRPMFPPTHWMPLPEPPEEKE